MNDASSAVHSNIRRFQNLLETSVNDAERRTIQKLLTEENLKAARQASEPPAK